MKPFRILLADDHRLVRAGIRALLGNIAGAQIVAEADNGREAVALAKAHNPDLVIMDISMRELNGIDAAAQIHALVPAPRILMLSMHAGDEFVRRAIKAGAAGYMVKDSAPVELEIAIRAILDGKIYLSPRVTRALVAGPVGVAGEGEMSALEALTIRQREVLQMIAEGGTTKGIAAALEVSIKTVETHRAALMERLGIHDVAGLVMFAVRHRLVPLDRPDA